LLAIRIEAARGDAREMRSAAAVVDEIADAAAAAGAVAVVVDGALVFEVGRRNSALLRIVGVHAERAVVGTVGARAALVERLAFSFAFTDEAAEKISRRVDGARRPKRAVDAGAAVGAFTFAFAFGAFAFALGAFAFALVAFVFSFTRIDRAGARRSEEREQHRAHDFRERMMRRDRRNGRESERNASHAEFVARRVPILNDGR